MYQASWSLPSRTTAFLHRLISFTHQPTAGSFRQVVLLREPQCFHYLASGMAGMAVVFITFQVAESVEPSIKPV